MRTTYLMMILVALTAFGARAQSSTAPADVESLPAYYGSLAVFSSKSAESAGDVDRLKFPYDAAAAEKRLSLKPYYLMGVEIADFRIPEPPANSSERTRAELNYLLRLQQHRSGYDIAASQAMAGIYYNPRVTAADSSYAAYRKNLFHIGHSLGTWFSPENLPVTADLMANVWRDASYFIWGLKYKYSRVRPYVLEPSLANLEETNWAAYPSGHAANSYINAFIFAALSPSEKPVFLRDAYDMAHSREILGVHYPSDSESARIFARQFVDKLFQNKVFLEDFARAKNEWATARTEDFSRKPVIDPEQKLSSKSCGAPKVSTCAQKCQ